MVRFFKLLCCKLSGSIYAVLLRLLSLVNFALLLPLVLSLSWWYNPVSPCEYIYHTIKQIIQRTLSLHFYLRPSKVEDSDARRTIVPSTIGLV